MVKMALSATIRHIMPTRPFDKGAKAASSGEKLAAGAFIWRNGDYSYFQSGSAGCLRSHSGRRLLTTGSSAKLYSGGGELVAHSKVQASHGSFPAICPFRRERMILKTKTSNPRAWKTAPMVQTKLS